MGSGEVRGDRGDAAPAGLAARAPTVFRTLPPWRASAVAPTIAFRFRHRGRPWLTVCYGCDVVSQHRRFELVDVMFDDIPIGRCTIDQWQDDSGGTQWAARVLMDRAHGSTSGQLVGKTREGGFLSGPATFATDQEGPRGRHMVLVELHGTGPLARTTDPATPADPAAPPNP